MADSDEALTEARDTAVRLLARREHSRTELRRKLRQRGFESRIIEETVASLAEDDWVSDARFAEAYVRSRAERGFGPVRIEAELRERGVADADAWVAAADVDWADLAAREYGKRFDAAAPADLRERARRERFLRYRGFTAEQVRACLSPDADE